MSLCPESLILAARSPHRAHRNALFGWHGVFKTFDFWSTFKHQKLLYKILDFQLFLDIGTIQRHHSAFPYGSTESCLLTRGGQGGGHELPRWPRPGLVLGRPIHPGLPRTIPLFSLKSCVPGHPKSLANGDSWRCCLVLSGTCLVPAHLRAWPLRHCFSHAQVPPQNDGQGCPLPESCFPPAPCHVL